MKSFPTYLLFLLLLSAGCTKPFEPPEIAVDYRYLVVDGFIQAGAPGVSTVSLSRTRKLDDTTYVLRPESGARVLIESEGGASYPMAEVQAGTYASGLLNLDPSRRYRLSLEAGNGRRYISDFVEVRPAPPIDSLEWEQEEDVSIYLNTHDPSNSTRYYRWDFTETWEYRTPYESNIVFRNGQLMFIDSTEYEWVCWQTAQSTNILLASTLALSEDRVHRQPIVHLPKGSPKIGVRYSVLVRQYALTPGAYAYWLIVQKNTQERGSLFDAQPARLKGNLHSVNDPQEPVIGYVSAGTVSEKRIFIRKNELRDWNVIDQGYNCDPIFIQPGQAASYLSSGIYAPAYYMTGGGLAIAQKQCVYCTTRGGTNRKPFFW